ncbi:serine hydrolase domain-containing protein [Spirillospora sp. CA-294931]|uniref:serine hydrolase domain-containing protein n=1 Tax=Spirillospora sp. CA-294931 TaxID=3240042 RepID=UPI003D8BFA57
MKRSLLALAAGAGMVVVTAVPGVADGREGGLDPARLQAGLDGIHKAGMPGVFASVRDGRATWRGASGVADTRTGRPVRPEMRHRVGSVTKSFVAAAVLQQVEKGRIRLDDPIGKHLPRLVPGPRGRRITVRMLLNHTSGIGDYVMSAFPSFQQNSPKSLDDNRHRAFRPAELIGLGLKAPATGEPGSTPGSYSNTNYVVLGQLIEKVTGTRAEAYITRNVIRRAGLRNTAFPAGEAIRAPHSRMYEALYGLIDPPRDYSVYNMSWAGTAGSLLSTMDDLNRFYRQLLGGKIVSRGMVARMQRTVPVRAGTTGPGSPYGLGIYPMRLPCGTFWGHDGAVWGAGTLSATRSDGKRQLSYAINLMKYNTLDGSGNPRPHPIDKAVPPFFLQATCGVGEGSAGAALAPRSLPLGGR